MINIKKYKGCFLGLAMGDAYGACYEGGPLERLLWKIIGKTKNGKMRYTDDTQMSIDLAESFLESDGINQTHLAITFTNSYHWPKGYGKSTSQLLKRIRRGGNWHDLNKSGFDSGSFGNGASMRSPIVAMCYPECREVMLKIVVKSAEITHAHPLGIEGAKLIASVTHAALHDLENKQILDALIQWCESEEFKTRATFCAEAVKCAHDIKLKVIRKNLGNGMTATTSCLSAIYFSLKYRDQNFSTMLNQIIKLGGDTDTIGSMAGAIWGAFRGIDSIDETKVRCIENHDKISRLAELIFKRAF